MEIQFSKKDYVLIGFYPLTNLFVAGSNTLIQTLNYILTFSIE